MPLSEVYNGSGAPAAPAGLVPPLHAHGLLIYVGRYRRNLSQNPYKSIATRNPYYPSEVPRAMRVRHAATLLISIVTTGLVPLAALAQEVNERPESAAPIDLLHGAITHLNQQKTIQTDIHQSVTMFGKTLTVTGRYVKGSADLQMRLELNVQIPRSATDLTGPTSLFMLVDGGQRLTLRESILGASQSITIDVKAVLDVLAEQEKQELRTLLVDLLGIGGLPQMLRGIKDTMDPNLWVRRENLEEAFSRETGHDVYVLQGQWRQELLERYLPPPAAAPNALPDAAAENERQPELPRFQPTHVLLYLDRQTGLPHRIEYQHHSRNPEKVRTIIVQECRDATFGEEIPQETFVWSSQTRDLIDMTDEWVGQLRTEPQFLEQLESAAQDGRSPLTLVVPGLMQEPDVAGRPIASP